MPSPELPAEVYCVRLNFNISKLAYSLARSLRLVLKMLRVNSCLAGVKQGSGRWRESESGNRRGRGRGRMPAIRTPIRDHKNPTVLKRFFKINAKLTD